MSEMPMREARSHFADLLDHAEAGEVVYVTRRGRRVAVVINADEYQRLVEAAEDNEDRAALIAARDDNDYVPWDEVKRDLGL